MTEPCLITTGDPRFQPNKPLKVNGYDFVPAGQIAWTLGEPPKQDGVVVYGHTWSPYRWKPYSPKSEQFRCGVKGRWQVMNEFGGWDNVKAPDEWASEEAVLARREGIA